MDPHYLSLRDRLMEDFWRRQPAELGAKLPTERELALRYRVSRPTIGKAIAALAAEGWVTKRQGSGIYISALVGSGKATKRGRKPRIGYVATSLRPILSHHVCQGIEQAATQAGRAVEIASTDWDYATERQKIAELRDHGVEGVVLYPTTRRGAEEDYLAAEFRDFPIVVVDLYQPSMRRPHFVFDNHEAGRGLTRWLLAQGRRDIAFLKFGEGVAYRSVDDRLAGHRRALADAALPEIDGRVIPFTGTGPLSPDHVEAMERFLALRPRPTALITPYDPYAHASIVWLRERGLRVPEDVVVAGFDNLQDEPWRERFPTTQPDFVRMGERAAEMLFERIGQRPTDSSGIVLPCPLWLPSGKGWAVSPAAVDSHRGLTKRQK